MQRLIQKITPSTPFRPHLVRVAAYARVSSGKDAMLHSLSAQIGYYTELIQSNPEWRFCGVFADEALTGTKDNRNEFQRLLSECRYGNIDLIITKSISRFARNTVTLLETVRELRDIGIDVLFEEQNIHTMSSEGELMLSILSAYAQEESYSASENQKWRIRKDFEEGKISTIRMIGYKRTSDGSLEIVPEEAEIVRMIFEEYLAGNGFLLIAKKLNEMKIKTLKGFEWNANDVHRILSNEKYAGNMLLQKSYRENHITKKKIINNGALPQFYVEESHPAIINSEMFESVEKMLKNRREKFTPSKPTTNKYPFSGIIQCACCGKNYRRKTTVTGIVWVCATYNTKGKRFCPTAKQIPENTMISVCCDVLKVPEFDVEIFAEQIERILVPAPNELIFIFTDGHEEKATWKDRSRSESWTDEMRANVGLANRNRRCNKCQK